MTPAQAQSLAEQWGLLNGPLSEQDAANFVFAIRRTAFEEAALHADPDAAERIRELWKKDTP